MNLKRHHVLYGLLAVSLIIALVIFLVPNTPDVSFKTNPSTQTATSTPEAMRFEIAATPASQERGLGGRSDIPGNYGMLFVFEKPDKYGFWMKDMLVSIDIIWLSDNGTILGVEDSVTPESYPDAFYPPEPVRYVLETRAGEVRAKGWSVGTKVPLPLPYGK